MKINCGPSPEAKREAAKVESWRLQKWHDFYAVWPRRVGENDCRCFELIERKGTYNHGGWDSCSYWTWEYRSKA